MTYSDEQLRAAHLAAFDALWRRPVLDPEDYLAVTAIFRANGSRTEYRNQAGAEYCGHTVAVAWRNIGDHLVPGQCVPVTVHDGLARYVLVSTARLADRGPWPDPTRDYPGSRWSDHGFERVCLQPEDIQPADLVVVVTSAKKSYGDHIVTARTSPDHLGNFETYEGNAPGVRGDGSWGKGVIKRTRNTRDVRQVFRIGSEHVVGLGHS